MSTESSKIYCCTVYWSLTVTEVTWSPNGRVQNQDEMHVVKEREV